MHRSIFRRIIPAGAFAMLLACAPPYSGARMPVAVKGVIDLRTWDFTVDGPVRLDGEWEFHWQRFAGDISKSERGGYIRPGAWNSFSSGTPIGGQGYATYRLQVLLPPGQRSMAIRNGEILTSARLNIFGTHHAIGKPGRTRADTIPVSRHTVHDFQNPGAVGAVTIEAANYFYRNGGMLEAPVLDLSERLHAATARDQLWQGMLAAIFLLFGLYHFVLHAIRRSPAALWFGATCLLFSLRSVLAGEQIVHLLLPDLDYRLDLGVEYLNLYLMVPLFSLFVHALFPELFPRWLCNLFMGAGGLPIATLVLPPESYSQLHIGFQVMAPIFIVVLITTAARAAYHGFPTAKTFLVAIVAAGAGGITDVAVAALFSINTMYTPIGLVGFVFLQAVAIARRFDGAFTQVESLSAELEGRNAELDRKNAELTRLDILKDQFLANTSHELRTPLHGIIGLAETLLEGAAGTVTDVLRRNLLLISSSGKRLAALVNDILDFQKLRNSDIQIALKAVDLRALADVVLAVTAPLLNGTKVILRNEVPESLPAVLGDEDRLQQILHNLLGNAVKFTDAGMISVFARVLDNSMVEVSVDDTGIGIPSDMHAAVFDNFRQADASSERSFGGAGLGLTIAKQLVELHGGTIRVESEPAKGSRFIFTLESGQEAAAPRTRESPEAIRRLEPDTAGRSIAQTALGERTGLSVLIVDDEPVNRQVLSNALALRNYRVMEAGDGETALRIVESECPDLVLLDIMMPKMSGYEVCRKLRETRTLSDLPIIMLTAKNQVSDMVEGMQVGANDYLPKPFSTEELLARMQTHLEMLRINEAVSRFVPLDFIHQLGKQSITEVELGDQVEKEMAIAFSDIRDFTALAETMTPKESFDFINAYLAKMGPLIRSHSGFIDKYIGDAIMALFPESAADALDAAIEMQRALRAFNKDRSGEPVRVGIGIHSGICRLGIVGESERTEGTVVADSVNACSRVEGLTKVYGAEILMTDRILARLPDRERYSYRLLDRVLVMGKLDGLSVFEVLDGKVDAVAALKIATRSAFEEGIGLYHTGAFAEAASRFRAVLDENTADPAAALYVERSESYAKHGAPPDWSGVWTADRK